MMGFMNKRGGSSKHPQKTMKHWRGPERRKLDQEERNREDDVMHASCGSACALLSSALLRPFRKSSRFSSPSEGGYVAMATGENLHPAPGSLGWVIRVHA